MKHVLITGGAGFIGSNLTEYFLSKAYKVTCLDNFATGHRHNIQPFLANPNYTLIEGDIRDLAVCHRAVEGVDYILHQAALGSVPRSINDPITSNEVNVSGFLNMLVAARDAKVKRFVYAASSSTYGDSENLPKVENIIGKPLSPYAITKYVNELYADIFSKTYGLSSIGLRYFNVFGPKQDPNGVYAAAIPKFIDKMIKGEVLTINGDGSQTRDFTYVMNAVIANILGLTTEVEGTFGNAFNVACGEFFSLNDVIKEIKENLIKLGKYNPNCQIVNGPDRAGDIRDSLANITQIKKYLGYNEPVCFKDGMDKYCNWLEKSNGL